MAVAHAAIAFAALFQTSADRWTKHKLHVELVLCPFFAKTGACRYGDRCGRVHERPVFSKTLLLSHMYIPVNSSEATSSEATPSLSKEQRTAFETFCEDVLTELSKYGKIDSFNVCANLSEHLFGNVIIIYSNELEAARALKAVHGRYYDGRKVIAELSPLTDLRVGKCQQFDSGLCSRGPYCNFLHIIPFG
ncbi:splicing factor U2af small subunit B [Pelomyxa schiedti]|nr:splicing factor U2af small subunit B [Pelomyxa schiedti]